MPQQLAGMRIDPPPSLPNASGPSPEAIAAAAPPLDPPHVFDRSQGFRVTPKMGLSVSGLCPNSGVVVLPSRIAPACFNLATGTASSLGTKLSKIADSTRG